MTYLINSIIDRKLNGSFSNSSNGFNCINYNSSNYSPLEGINYSFDKTKGHTFFVDSSFLLNESSISLSLSSSEFKDFGEGSNYIKIGVH